MRMILSTFYPKKGCCAGPGLKCQFKKTKCENLALIHFQDESNYPLDYSLRLCEKHTLVMVKEVLKESK